MGYAAPQFQSDGRIIHGDYQLVMRPSGVLNLMDAEGRSYDFFLPMGYPDRPGRLDPGQLKDAKVTVDEETRTTTFSALVEPEKGTPFPIRYAMHLADNGKVRVTLKADVKGPFEKHFRLGNRLHVTRDVVSGGNVSMDGQVFPIDPAPSEKQTRLGTVRQRPVVLNEGMPEKRLAILPVTDVQIVASIVSNASYRPPFLDVNFEMKGNTLAYDLELPEVVAKPKSEHTYAGIDFWALDRLPMPQYGASRNLVQNPGFEAGFNYWRLNSYGDMSGEPKFDSYYRISSEGPRSGSHVLALRGEPGQSPAQVSSFAIPVEKGREYTLSFYARADQPGVELGVSAQGFFDTAGRVLHRNAKLGKEWQRFSYTFKAPHHVLSVGFGNHNPALESEIFVDDVQLEHAATASEYTTKALLSSIVTDARGNLWQPGGDPNARVEFSGAPGAKGRVRLTQTDFFGKETDRGSLEFTLDDKGRAALTLPWAADLPLGLYVIKSDVQTDDGFSGTDYGRLTVMRFLSNTHKHKNIFNSPFNWRYPEWKRDLEFYKRLGIGSSMLHDPAPHRYHEIMKENGILFFSSIYDGGHGFKEMGWHQKDGQFDLSDEQLAKIEELSYRKAKEYPEIRYWKFFNEPHVSDFLAHQEMFPKMQKAILAAQRGILRATPEAVFVASDPANMFVNSGMAFVDKQLAAAKGVRLFDIAAIHPYRARPEEPDRDKDTATFLGILDRHGFKGEVWFTEGIYHQNYVIPLWELNTHQGCSSDHYRAGAASYGLGWGEKMAAAYAARSWLVSLKYGDRVKMDVDWGFWNHSRSDLDNTPCALAFASNTLGNILGNADFRQDLQLGYGVRCYVFENEKKQPVAVIWYANLDCDKGRAEGPSLDVAALNAAMRDLPYADFVGNTHVLGDTLKLSPFPIFLTGPEGGLAEFTDKLGQAALVGGKGQLHAWLRLESKEEIQVVVENTLNRKVAGTYRLLRGEDVLASGDLEIGPMAEWTRAFPGNLKSNTLNQTEVILEITPSQGDPARFDLRGSWMLWPQCAESPTMDGSFKGWEKAFRMPIFNKVEFAPHDARQRALSPDMNPFPWKGEADLSATLYATWDAANLYLAVEVMDEITHAAESPQRGWAGDGLQLYFDGWADAAGQRAGDYDGNDQSFIVWPKPPEATVFRDVAPERQLAFLDQGIVQDARAAAVKTADGRLAYFVTLPLRDIQPVKLEALQKFGFAVLVNEHDGDYRKRSLTVTPEKTEPYRNPHLYPTVLLTP
jgi:hypothetical protein